MVLFADKADWNPMLPLLPNGASFSWESLMRVTVFLLGRNCCVPEVGEKRWGKKTLPD